MDSRRSSCVDSQRAPLRRSGSVPGLRGRPAGQRVTGELARVCLGVGGWGVHCGDEELRDDERQARTTTIVSIHLHCSMCSGLDNFAVQLWLCNLAAPFRDYCPNMISLAVQANLYLFELAQSASSLTLCFIFFQSSW